MAEDELSCEQVRRMLDALLDTSLPVRFYNADDGEYCTIENVTVRDGRIVLSGVLSEEDNEED